MKPIASAAIALAALAMTGCTQYHPASLSPSPYGISSVQSRIVTDPSLKERYPSSADVAETRFPDGAVVPAPRPAGEDWGVAPQAGWTTTRLGREAESRTIARDMPHAVVSPWGTAKGF